MTFRRVTLFAFVAAVSGTVFLLHSKTVTTPPIPEIRLLRTPNKGIQPQVVVDSEGMLHMIYFRGDASAGDIEYVRRAPGEKVFSSPIRVNSRLRSALAVGTVRGPQMALGREGRIYVVWFGSQKEPGGRNDPVPLFFSRLNDSGTAFEPQRNLIQYANGLDGGLSVAADSRGNVFVVWHARGDVPGEAHRRVYVARSTDDGRHFAREVPISPASLGACGCCGMRAFVDHRGTLYVLYRAAAEGIHRDITLLLSSDQGQSFRVERLGPWNLNACPMSTEYLSEGGRKVLAAWETAGQVYFTTIDPRSQRISSAFSAPGAAEGRKHPALAANSRGQVLLAWTEGTSWEKGGALGWQLFDAAGRPILPPGHASGVPVWGLPSVFGDRQGNFTIVY
jgi:hypothetical protein